MVKIEITTKSIANTLNDGNCILSALFRKTFELSAFIAMQNLLLLLPLQLRKGLLRFLTRSVNRMSFLVPQVRLHI